MNAKRALVWAALLLLAILLIIAGFQGSLGRLLAVVVAPAELQVKTS